MSIILRYVIFIYATCIIFFRKFLFVLSFQVINCMLLIIIVLLILSQLYKFNPWLIFYPIWSKTELKCKFTGIIFDCVSFIEFLFYNLVSDGSFQLLNNTHISRNVFRTVVFDVYSIHVFRAWERNIRPPLSQQT